MFVPMRIRGFSTTIPGIEDIACNEVESLLGCRSEPGVGRIFFEAGTESIYLLNLGARTLHKIFRIETLAPKNLEAIRLR